MLAAILTVGSRDCVLGVEKIYETMVEPDILSLAGTEPFIAGVVRFGGEAVTVVDLGKVLPGAVHAARDVLLLEIHHRKIGFIADKVRSESRINFEHMKPLPGDFPEALKTLLLGLVQDPDDLEKALPVLRAEAFLEKGHAPMPAASAPAAAAVSTNHTSASPGAPLVPKKRVLPRKDDGSAYTFMIVDDTKLIVKSLERYITDWGGEIIATAKHGKEALAFYKELPRKPDLMTTDLNMPEMGGKDLIREILAVNPQQKIIAVSTAGFEKEIQECFKLGAKHFVVKPLQPENIYKIFMAVLGFRLAAR